MISEGLEARSLKNHWFPMFSLFFEVIPPDDRILGDAFQGVHQGEAYQGRPPPPQSHPGDASWSLPRLPQASPLPYGFYVFLCHGGNVLKKKNKISTKLWFSFIFMKV